MVAYHESGHALVAFMLENFDPLFKITIVSRGMAGGYTSVLPEEDRHINTRSYLEKIPKELEEAAFVDGASRLYTLRRVVIPLAIPGLIVVGTAVYIGAYAQQFLFAITFNNVREIQPLPAGLFEFVGYQDTTWNELMAAALTGITPVMVVFLFLQKFLVAGLTAGAVKE